MTSAPVGFSVGAMEPASKRKSLPLCSTIRSMSWVYSQSTGRLTRNGQTVATGYSGAGSGRNNGQVEAQRNVGPIPRGLYTIGPARDTSTHGPHAMTLTPDGHNARGRDGFMIHGDNTRHDASTGCVILPRDVREQISNSRDNELEVVP